MTDANTDRSRAERELREALSRKLLQHIEREFERMLDRVASGEIDSSAAADALLAAGLELRSGVNAFGARVAPNALTPDLNSVGALDHIGIAVEDSSPLSALFANLFGLTTGDAEQVGPHRLRFVQSGDTTLELVEPLSDDAPVAKFIAKKGAGLHHICIRVADIERAMAELVAKGVQFIDAVPRSGAHGSRIAFIHPSSACGLLVEIKQSAAVAHDH